MNEVRGVLWRERGNHVTISYCLLLMRDEKAVCSRLDDADLFASMTRILEGLMPCDLLGLGLWTWDWDWD